MDWETRAKNLFYNEQAADDVEEDESMSRKIAQKKAAVQLESCIDLFTSKEQLGANDTWSEQNNA